MSTAITALMPLKHYHPPFLKAAIDSLVQQTTHHWQLLVIVEPEDLRFFRDQLATVLLDSRIRLVPNEGGRYPGAFNTGMRQARTEFVAILLGDDLWDARAVEVLEAHIEEHPQVDFFHTGRRIIDDEGRSIGRIFLPPGEFATEDFRWRSPVKHLLCWRRSRGLTVGGVDEAVLHVGPDDYDFPWTMLEHGSVFKAIPDPLYVYRDHRTGFRLTTHLPRDLHLEELRYILTKHGVPARLIRERLRIAKKGFLRQCLYRNKVDRWIKQRLRRGSRPAWRLDYSK